MKAEEARERVKLVKQEQALDRRKKQNQYELMIIGQVDDEIDREIEEHDILIKDATAEGHWEITSTRDNNEMELAMVRRLAEYYKDSGYSAKTVKITVDHGDSAAPCRVDEASPDD